MSVVSVSDFGDLCTVYTTLGTATSKHDPTYTPHTTDGPLPHASNNLTHLVSACSGYIKGLCWQWSVHGSCF